MRNKPFLFLFLYILFHYSLLFYLEGNPILLSNISNVLLTFGILISGIILLKAITNKNNPNRKFTLLLFIGCFFYFLASCYWTYFENANGIPPTLGLYDGVMFLAYTFFLFALIYYLKTHKVVFATTYLFDILIFIVIISTLSWVFIIRPFLITSFDGYSLLTLIVNLGYPIADLSVLFACMIIFLYTTLSRSILFIIFGFLINIVANGINFYQSLHTPYNFGHFIDPLWAISILLIGYSGLNNFAETKDNKKTHSPNYIQLFVPYTIMIIFLFVVYINFYDIKDPLLIGVFISILLLLIRLFSTLFRNEALHQEIKQKNLQLNAANDKLKFIAYHDELTQLPNRHLLFEKMEGGMNHNYFYLLFIDLDGFKAVNDTFGHNLGDLLLKQVAIRLKEQSAERDFLCRFAGDEFIMLLSDREKSGAERMATAIVETLSKPFLIESYELSISSSIGISSFKDADSMLTVINNADKAMYFIKKNGKNGYQFL